MSAWLISRTVGNVTRYRGASGRLTTERADAKLYPSCTAAVPHSQEGDTIEPAALPQQIEPRPFTYYYPEEA